MQPDVKIFKLNYAGGFDAPEEKNILDLFALVNILAIYVQKRMYFWIGSQATRSLKNFIVQTRAILSSDEFSDLRIIRNFTVESGDEPYDFFDLVGISKEELQEYLQAQQKKIDPVINEITELKTAVDDHFEAKEFELAIESSRKIIELAKKIDDSALEKDQLNFIAIVTKKVEHEKLTALANEEIGRIKTEYERLIGANDIVRAHEIIEDFKQKYEEIELPPIARDVVLEEEKIWRDYLNDQENILTELARLEKNIIESLKKDDLSGADGILNKAKDLLETVVAADIKSKWNAIEAGLLKKREIQEKERKFKDDQEKLEEKAKELERFDGLKDKIRELVKKGKEALDEGNIIKSFSYNKEIVNLLEDNSN